MTMINAFFEQSLPQAMQRDPQRARELNGVFVIQLSGEGGGSWTIDAKADPPTVAAGVSATADCKVELTATDFLAMLKDPQLGMQLFLEGRLVVQGDPMLATRLQDLLSLAG
ncbi:MAG: SCP2 sterol-binding domain-containing protein [Proteobacteria bacterium]|nr:SCP2 sterol-binding domain-containing protein [Pseudomonadota bacterium]